MASRSGDSKQGLIISLVIFVLLTIILGVTTYMGYAEQENLRKQVGEARQAETAAKTGQNWEKFKALLFKSYAGFESGNDLAELGTLKDQFTSNTIGQSERDKAEIEAVVRQLDAPNGDLGWDAANKRPAKNYRTVVDAQKKAIANAQAEREKLIRAAASSKEEYDSVNTAQAAELAKTKEALANAERRNVELQNQQSEAYKGALARIDNNEKDLEKFKNDLADSTDKRAKDAKRFEEDKEDLRKREEKLRQKIPEEHPLEKDQPKGKIINLDRYGTTAYINLGTLDNVKPGLTFSVVGVQPGGKPSKEIKASLQVADVLNEHLSSARITSVKDPKRSPVLTNDLIYNPVWSPTMHQHIALAGLIDITGDGRDDTPEFIRSLQKQGITIDAYLDLKDRAVKGKGLSYQTDYLVIGETPEYTTAEAYRGNAYTEVKSEIHKQIAEMTKQAEKLGVPVISLRRFVTVIGYRLPSGASGPARADFNLYRAAPKTTTDGTPAETPPAEPMPAETTPKEKGT